MKLDFIDNIEIHPGITPIANYHSIQQLKEGLFMVYVKMGKIERNYWHLRYPEATQEQIDIHKKSIFSFSGEPNQVDAQAVNLFHWYSINLINYVKCCGLIKFLNEKMIQPESIAANKILIAELKKTQKDYMAQIPELIPVIHFRNKAAAHLAYADPRNNDNPATLVESMTIIPTFLEGKMTLGTMKMGKGDHTSSFADHQWNLTDNFNSLIPRYFIENFG